MRALKIMFVLAAAGGVLLSGAAPAHAAGGFFSCSPILVAAQHDTTPATDRITVQCSTNLVDQGVTITYFAVPSSDGVWANRFMTLATTALTTGRTMSIGYNPGQSTDNSGTAFGCASSNCRYVVQVNLN